MEKYSYTPRESKQFRCKAPLVNTSQFFVTDGLLEETPHSAPAASLGELSPEPCGCSIEKGAAGTGYALKYAKGRTAENYLQIISVRNAENPLNYKNSIALEEHSVANVLLCFHTVENKELKTDEYFNIEIKERALLNLVVMQNEHGKSIHNTDFNITLGKDAFLNLHIITLHGGEISNNLSINLNGKGGDCRLNGLYLASGEQRISNKVNIYHNVGECHSNQLFKGILSGNAVTNFSGTIYVEKNAQKSEAYQANNNLLASDTAFAHTQPHLEIYADDVKCSHGATIGSLNEEELFYMRSRGISKEEGKLLQQLAFANAVLEEIRNTELKERLASLVEKRLRGEFSHTGICSAEHC